MRIPRSDVIDHLADLDADVDARRRAEEELPDPVDTSADAGLLHELGIDVDGLERWARARHSGPAVANEPPAVGDAAMEESWDERDL